MPMSRVRTPRRSSPVSKPNTRATSVKLPHVSTYKRRWVRRIMIVVSFPKAIFQALRGVFRGASFWWNQP